MVHDRMSAGMASDLLRAQGGAQSEAAVSRADQGRVGADGGGEPGAAAVIAAAGGAVRGADACRPRGALSRAQELPASAKGSHM